MSSSNQSGYTKYSAPIVFKAMRVLKMILSASRNPGISENSGSTIIGQYPLLMGFSLPLRNRDGCFVTRLPGNTHAAMQSRISRGTLQ